MENGLLDVVHYPEPRLMPKLYQVKSKRGDSFLCRENTADGGIVKGFMNDYDRYIKIFNADETWLDVGAHIGTFAATAAAQVKQVIAFEACPETFEVLKKNTEHLPNVACGHCAVVGIEQPTVRFTQSAGRTMGHVATKHGRSYIEVPGVSFNSLLTQTLADRLCVKMDIEGGERTILDHLTDWSPISRFMLEFHSNAMHDRDHSYCKRTLAQFRKHFKTVETNFNEEKHHWVWYIFGEK